MRKVVFWIIAIVAFIIVLTKTNDIANLLDTMTHGAAIPLVLAAVFQVGRYFAQGSGMQAAFRTVNEPPNNLKKTVSLVISGIFVNTIAPTGGAASMLLLVNDGIKRGVPAGKSTSASMLGMMGNYTGFIVIMTIGFVSLGASGHLDPVAFICGMLMVLIVAFLGGVLFVCRKNPDMLRMFFGTIEKAVAKVYRKIRRKEQTPWADRFVDAFTEAATEIAKKPSNLLQILARCTLASSLEMLCFICVGLAFNVNQVNVLVAGYVVTYIFTVISPSPNGVGVAEAAATLTLTSYGTPLSTATAVALVFRGFVFWIPFAIGAFMLRRTGLFDERADATDDEKARADAIVSGILVALFGIINVFFALLPRIPAEYQVLSDWFSFSGVFTPTATVVLGLLLAFSARDIAMRTRAGWALTMALVVFLAAAQLLNATVTRGRYFVAVALIALGVWLFYKRKIFNKVGFYNPRRGLVEPLAIVIVVVLSYTFFGYLMLGTDYFGFTDQPLDALRATAGTLVPGLDNPEPISAYGKWFVRSVFYVLAVSILWLVYTVLTSSIRTRRYIRLGRAVVRDGKVHLVDHDAVADDEVAGDEVELILDLEEPDEELQAVHLEDILEAHRIKDGM